jgi:hypothetical protein
LASDAPREAHNLRGYIFRLTRTRTDKDNTREGYQESRGPRNAGQVKRADRQSRDLIPKAKAHTLSGTSDVNRGLDLPESQVPLPEDLEVLAPFRPSPLESGHYSDMALEFMPFTQLRRGGESKAIQTISEPQTWEGTGT